jgi:hypothetical protein
MLPDGVGSSGESEFWHPSRQVQTFTCGHEVKGERLRSADADGLDVKRRQSEETVTPIDPEE